jgi:hypothetical protein
LFFAFAEVTELLLCQFDYFGNALSLRFGFHDKMVSITVKRAKANEL